MWGMYWLASFQTWHYSRMCMCACMQLCIIALLVCVYMCVCVCVCVCKCVCVCMHVCVYVCMYVFVVQPYHTDSDSNVSFTVRCKNEARKKYEHVHVYVYLRTQNIYRLVLKQKYYLLSDTRMERVYMCMNMFTCAVWPPHTKHTATCKIIETFQRFPTAFGTNLLLNTVGAFFLFEYFASRSICRLVLKQEYYVLPDPRMGRGKKLWTCACVCLLVQCAYAHNIYRLIFKQNTILLPDSGRMERKKEASLAGREKAERTWRETRGKATFQRREKIEHFCVFIYMNAERNMARNVCAKMALYHGRGRERSHQSMYINTSMQSVTWREMYAPKWHCSI